MEKYDPQTSLWITGEPQTSISPLQSAKSPRRKQSPDHAPASSEHSQLSRTGTEGIQIPRTEQSAEARLLESAPRSEATASKADELANHLAMKLP